MSEGNELLRAALDYAGKEFRVFPLAPSDKVPLKGSRGFTDATTDSQTIREWWGRTPGANVGIATGSVSGLLVVDMDMGGGKNGLATLKALEKRHGPLPQTYTVQTPHGGRHFYFRIPIGREVKSGQDKLGRHLDLKAEGGYGGAFQATI